MTPEEENRYRENQDRMMYEREERRARRLEAQRRQQRQSFIIICGFLIALIIIIIVLSKGCSKKDKPAAEESSAQQTSEIQPAQDTEAETSEATVPETSESSESSESSVPEDSSEEPAEESQEESSSDEQIGAPEEWDLYSLDNEEKNFGYSRDNRDDRGVPTDWQWYENQWGQFNVDWIQDTDQNIIYLTMDEGFPNDYTSTILDILEEKNVKATFFLTKMFLDGGEASYAQIQRMIDLGCVLGNHTCTHPAMPELSIEEQTEEIMGVHRIVEEQFGYDMKLFRFPEGKYSARSLGLVDNLGYKTVFWSYAYNDYSAEQPPVQESYEQAVNWLHPGAIFLLHANSSTNTAFLADWIDAARAAGYEFGVYPLAYN